MLVFPAAASANTSNISTGQAYDLAIKTSPLNTLVTVGPVVGPITSNTTTHNSQSAASVTTAIASANVLSASVDTSNEGAVSMAQVASASIFIPGLPTISASLVNATATASCRNHGTTTGGSSLGTITVNGQTISIAVPPNTMISLGLAGSITLNEQTKTGNSITVNAIDVRTVLGTQVVVASATAGVTNCA